MEIRHRSISRVSNKDSSPDPRRRLVYSRLVVSIIIVTLSVSFTGRSVKAQEITYTLSPAVSATAWANELGLDDAVLYGGKLGIDFGPLIGLEASYLTTDNLWTAFSELALVDTAGRLVLDQRLKVKRFGGDLILRWPSDRIAPFVKVGGGVIRFEPESGDKTEKIDVRFGGGIDYIVTSRVRARAWTEMNRFRIDRYLLAPGGPASGEYPLDMEAGKIRNSFSVGLSLDYALGQSRFRDVSTAERLQPFSVLEFEPVMGRLDFDDSRMKNITVAGFRTGGELNPWVGWGFYYWHAMKSDLSDTKPLQSFGGEARFGLASKTGPQPYIIIGAGQLDFRSGYVDKEGTERDDRTALILGTGIRAEIFNGIRLNISARDYMYGEGRVDRVSGTEEISHNWLLSAAVVFGIGGRGDSQKQRPLKPETIQPHMPVVSPSPDTTRISTPPSDTVKNATILNPSQQNTATSYVSDKVVAIPVPLEGEIYIRYGQPSRDSEKKEPGVVEHLSHRDSTLLKTVPMSEEKSLDSSQTQKAAPYQDTTDTVKKEKEQGAPLLRSELDSLIDILRMDIANMLETQSKKPTSAAQETTRDTVDSAISEDSVLLTLRKELAASEQERKRLDSLLEVQSATPKSAFDSISEVRIQQAIADQVTAALASKSESTAGELSQTDIQKMMSALAVRMDSLSLQRTAVDSARLQDQLKLEIIRQTRTQEDFQRALEDFMKQYAQRPEVKTGTTPAVIVTQPMPSPQIVDHEQPATIIVKPDTQFVMIQDSTRLLQDALPVGGIDLTIEPEKEKGFIDLRPAGYIGLGLERPKQFIVGGRLDMGPITAKEERLRLVPEFALGLGGGGASVMAVLNAEYRITEIKSGNYEMIPYARMGFGVIGFGGDISDRNADGVLNFVYGISVDPGKKGFLRDIGAPAIFLEHQIIDLFDLNRIALGLQWIP